MLKSKDKSENKRSYRIVLGITTLIMIVFVLIALILINKNQRRSEQIFNHTYITSKAVRDIKSNIIMTRLSMKEILLENDTKVINIDKNKIAEIDQMNLQLFDTIFNADLGYVDEIKKTYNLYNKWQAIRDEIIRLSLKKEDIEAFNISKTEEKIMIESLTNQVDSTVSIFNKITTTTFNTSNEKQKRIIRTLITITIIFIFFITTVLLYLAIKVRAQKKAEYALIESERRYATLISNLPGIVYQCKNDPNWTMLFISSGCKELTGYEQQELLNNKKLSYADIIHPDDQEFIWKNIQEALKNNTYFKFQYRIITKLGQIKWVWEQGIGVYDENGVFQNLEGFITDITERKNVEDILRESEEEHRSFLNNSLEGLYILKDGKIHFCNDKMAHIFGFKNAKEITGVSVNELVHPDSLELVKEKIRLREEGIEKITHYEFKGLKKDGSIILLETLGGQIVIKSQTAVQGALRDITKQKESEELLRKLSRSVEQSPTSILITDITGRIEYVNPQFINLTGYTLDEIRGRNPHILKSGHTPNDVYKKMWQTITSGNEWKGELLNKKKNGEYYWEAAIISPIKDNTGTITHFLGIKEDITDRKVIEEELIHAKEKAEESDKLKTSFLANMSHEIRTPMNAIMGFSGLLADETLSDEERDEFIKLINNNSNNLLNLIDDIVDIAKIEAGQLKLSIKDFDLIEILAELNATYQEINSNQNGEEVKLVWEKPQTNEPIFIKSDSHRIKQVLSNLIGNAIKYTEKGTVKFGFKIIEESTDKKALKKIQFYVNDTGIGIPSNRMDIIFDRFRQADDSHTRIFGGTGLGLAISKNIAKLLRGDIKAVSTVNKGSVFYFSLPFIKSKNPKNKNKLPEVDIEDINWEGKTVLIAEDVDSNFYLLETLLKRTSISIIWSKDGQLAIDEITNNNSIDIVLMDMQMPVLNGFDATKKIKEINHSLPVIAVTAFALQGDRNKILQVGCDDYISKPIKSNELYSKMSNFIN